MAHVHDWINETSHWWKSRIYSQYHTQTQSPIESGYVLLSAVWFSGCLLVCFSGFVLSFFTSPSLMPMRGHDSREVVPVIAKETLVDIDADTLARTGDVFFLPRNIETTNVEYGEYDSNDVQLLTIYNGTIITPSVAFSHLHFGILRTVPWGKSLRTVHQWSASLLVASGWILLILTLFIEPLFFHKRELLWFGAIAVSTLVYCTSWIGSLLPWSLRSELSYGTVIGLIEEYVPFGGSIGYVFRMQEHSLTPSLQLFYSLHTIVIPVILLIVIYSIYKIVPVVDKTQFRKVFLTWKLPGIISLMIIAMALIPYYNPVYTQLPALMISVLHTPSTLTSLVSTIKPEWYFLAPYYYLHDLPSDFVALMGYVVISSIFFLPYIHRKYGIRIMRMYIGVILILFGFGYFGALLIP